MKTINLITICIFTLFCAFGSNCHADDKKRAIKVTSKLLFNKKKNSHFIGKWKKKLVFKSKRKNRKADIKVQGNRKVAKKLNDKNLPFNRVPSSIKINKNEKAVFSYFINPLKGRGNIRIEKAFIDGSVNLKSFKKLSATVKKDISALKIQTAFHYQINENTWEASINKNINENVSTRVTTNHNSEIKSGVYFNYSF
jgi:hypothetical protein